MFGLPERREYPMPDAAHVRAAEAYFRYCPEELKPKLAKAILRFAASYGVDVESNTVRSYAEKQSQRQNNSSAGCPAMSRCPALPLFCG